MKQYIYVLLSLAFLLSACDNDEPNPKREKGTRTVLAYLAADNSLSGLASVDIDEMMKGMEAVDTQCNMLVYLDDESREGGSYYTPPTLYCLSKDKNGKVAKEIVHQYKEQISTDPAVMLEVLTRAFAEYPADSYGLVLWSHGDGWIPNPLPIKKNTSTRWVGQDTTNGTTYLNLADMVSVLKQVPHLDFILFDACFGQAIEVAYELRTCADYIIGSPTEIPGPGAVYDLVVPAMFATKNVGLEIGKAYYQPYEKKYTGSVPASNSNWTGGVSVSVIKCAALDELASVTKQTLSSVDLNTLLNSNLFNYDKRSSYDSYYVGYYDMMQLMTYTLVDIEAWTSAVQNAIIYWKTTPKNYSGIINNLFPIPQETTCGVSHYIPLTTTSSVVAAYRSTAWYKAAGLSKLGW